MLWIRADGNAFIGAGHLMRCLTIADEVCKISGGKENIVFICADERSSAFVNARGYTALVLGTDYTKMEEEKQTITGIMSQYKNKHVSALPDPNKTDVILIDSYYVSDDYLSYMRNLGRVVLMDDMADRVYPADCVVNYNIFADSSQYRQLYAGSKARLCIGSAYIPIREQFKDSKYRIRNKVENVLITTGGGDSENIAGRILAALNGCNDISELKENTNKLNYHLIIGKFNPNLEEMKMLSERCPWVSIHVDVKDMASLMVQCDLAVTAGGTTVYELAAVGVPMIVFSYAGNQEQLADYIGSSKIAGYGGKYHINQEETLRNIASLFTRYRDNINIRNTCYSKEKQLVDGKGGARLAEMLCEIMQNGD
jgi:UDP-2,4-diacetamido-2,4,6-trideoxy-beta-L-altropyranose hydrolase